MDRRSIARILVLAALVGGLVHSPARAQTGATIHLEIDGGSNPGTFDVTTETPCVVFDFVDTEQWEVSLDDPDQAPSYLSLGTVGSEGTFTASWPEGGGGYDAFDFEVTVEEDEGSATMTATIPAQDWGGTEATIALRVECHELDDTRAPDPAEGPPGTTSPSRTVGPTEPFCSILTVDELTDALGPWGVVEFRGSDTDCRWDSAQLRVGYPFLGLYAVYRTSSIDESGDRDFGGVDLEVAGNSAFYMEGMGPSLDVDLPAGGSLSLAYTGGDPGAEVDLQTALTQLAELALPRLAGLDLPTPPPPAPTLTPAPMPSFVGDPELAAMLPIEVGGTTLQAQTLTWSELLEVVPFQPDEAIVEEVTQALAAQGRTLDDVTIAVAGSESPRILIQALRVKGGDVTALPPGVPQLVGWTFVDPLTAPGQVAGKDVTVVTDRENADHPPRYLYANGEIFWAVEADEPALSEIFEQLP